MASKSKIYARLTSLLKEEKNLNDDNKVSERERDSFINISLTLKKLLYDGRDDDEDTKQLEATYWRVVCSREEEKLKFQWNFYEWNKTEEFLDTPPAGGSI